MSTGSIFGRSTGVIIPGVDRPALAATIPIAIADAQGRLRAGNKILLTAAGAGLVTAGAVVRW